MNVCREHGTLVVMPKAIVLSMTTEATQPVVPFSCSVEPLRIAYHWHRTRTADTTRHGLVARPALANAVRASATPCLLTGPRLGLNVGLCSAPSQVGILDRVEGS